MLGINEKNDNKMTDHNTPRSLIIGVAIKVLIVVGIGTGIAFWYMSNL